MKTNRVEQHRITKGNPNWIIIDELCWKSKNLYNYANYMIRQEFINTSKEKEQGIRENANWIRCNELMKMLKNSEPYKDLGSASSQQTLRVLDKNWKSFFAGVKDYGKNPSKYKGKPRLPKYLNKENGRFQLIVKNQSFKIVDGYIQFSWKPLKSLNNKYMTNINTDKSKLMQCRFVPNGKDYIMEIVYEIEVTDICNETKRIASIDLGINNLMTITNNCRLQPFILNGKPLKSINQFYNKEKAKIQSDLKLKHNMNWSNRLQQLTTKRNNKVDDYIHKASKQVVDYCIENNIDTLVCGYNEGWKQDSTLSKKVNQKFIQIPYRNLVQKLEYKCENVGIIFKTTNESYTSGTSFLDKELPKKENYNKGRRKYRGLFIANDGREINADVNGSYQIMIKAFPNAFADGIKDVGCHPVRVNIN